MTSRLFKDDWVIRGPSFYRWFRRKLRINSPKIFAVGLSKTGTTSLTSALETLGYKAVHYPGFSHVEGKCEIHPKILMEYDAFTDTPVAASYPQLDQSFPGSKFILTTRDEESWLRSCKRHFWKGRFDNRRNANKLHIKLYGHTYFQKEDFHENHERHVEEVENVFRGSAK